MKGLIFSEPMVKAWLEDRKTITRRLMNPQPPNGMQIRSFAEDWKFYFGNSDDQFSQSIKPPYRPGETVYIRETWAQLDIPNGDKVEKTLVYKATDWKCWLEYEKDDPIKWKSPYFMFEWAARSHALIVSVRPERVQEITEGEAILEGFMFAGHGDDWMRHDSFRVTWEKLHPGSWDRNDWVWRIELEKQ